MAMGEGSNRINLESDTTAEATAFDHQYHPWVALRHTDDAAT
jgi:hypothetical protein